MQFLAINKCFSDLRMTEAGPAAAREPKRETVHIVRSWTVNRNTAGLNRRIHPSPRNENSEKHSIYHIKQINRKEIDTNQMFTKF